MSPRPLSPASARPDKRWVAQLEQVRSDAELLRVCRRYLLSIRGAAGGGLPLACRPIPLDDPTDLSAYALQLVRYRCAVENPSPLVVRMSAFFVHANMRMAQMLGHMNDMAEADIILAGIGRQPGRDRGRNGSPSSSGDVV